MDERRARATLTDAGTTVALEFEFGPRSEIVGAFTPGRPRAVPGRQGEYLTAPWGGYQDYEEQQGLRVPMAAEVYWVLDGMERPYYRGRNVALEYQLERLEGGSMRTGTRRRSGRHRTGPLPSRPALVAPAARARGARSRALPHRAEDDAPIKAPAERNAARERTVAALASGAVSWVGPAAAPPLPAGGRCGAAPAPGLPRPAAAARPPPGAAPGSPPGRTPRRPAG